MDEEYLESVLDLVDRIPRGRVMTYGTIAEVVGDDLRRGGPRQVGTVLARAGSGVPWWRVVNASGLPPTHKRDEALRTLHDEGCPLSDDEQAEHAGRSGHGGRRVVLRRALWWPDEDDGRAGERSGERAP